MTAIVPFLANVQVNLPTEEPTARSGIMPYAADSLGGCHDRTTPTRRWKISTKGYISLKIYAELLKALVCHA